MDGSAAGWRDPEPPRGPDRLFAFAGRHRGASIAALIALVVLAALAFNLVSLAIRYAEGPSPEAAIAAANRTNGRDLSYALVSERVEPDGSVVYRLVSDSEPLVYREQRYRFRWLPELSVYSGMPIPSLDMPGPYYELANGEEFRKALNEWRSEQKRREGRDRQSLHPQRTPEEEAEAEEN